MSNLTKARRFFWGVAKLVKAADFDSAMRGFESFLPSQKIVRTTEGKRFSLWSSVEHNTPLERRVVFSDGTCRDKRVS